MASGKNQPIPETRDVYWRKDGGKPNDPPPPSPVLDFLTGFMFGWVVAIGEDITGQNTPGVDDDGYRWGQLFGHLVDGGIGAGLMAYGLTESASAVALAPTTGGASLIALPASTSLVVGGFLIANNSYNNFWEDLTQFNFAEHKKNARKSTLSKHQKGQSRQQQKYTDKKRNQKKWQQNRNKKK